MNNNVKTQLYINKPGSYQYDQARAYAIEFYQYAYKASILSNADVFCSAYHNSRHLGCFGLYYPITHNPLLAESYLSNERLNDYLVDGDRNHLVEFGSLAIDLKKYIRMFPIMAAAMTIHALEQGYTHAIYTATKTWGHWIANYMFGAPIIFESPIDIDTKDKEFKENWKYYFIKKRFCFGILLENAILGSIRILDKSHVEISNGA